MGVYSDVMEQFLNMPEMIKAYRFVCVKDNPSARNPHADLNHKASGDTCQTPYSGKRPLS